MTAVKFEPAGEKKSWRPKKTKLPDAGSYDFWKSKDWAGKSIEKHRFAPPQQGRRFQNQVKGKETFTTQASKGKKFVPGVGSYDPKIDYVAKPYGRKRGG